MIITRAPFRIPLGGGGTDLPSYYSKFGGNLISVGINKYLVATVNSPVVDKLIRLKYSKSETVSGVGEIEHQLIKHALLLTKIKHSIELSFIADLPAGSGMGSSGSFLVALLKALHVFKREDITTHQIAEEACRIEIDILKNTVGKQDQYLAAFGGLTQLIIDKKGKVEVIKPKVSEETLSELEDSLIVFYTGIHRSASEVLSAQNKSTTQGEKHVLDSLHYIKEIGQEILANLERGNITGFGKLLDTHWRYKRKLSNKISSTAIDEWYEAGLDAGALGGKIIGAGGGGFLLFCCLGNKMNLRKAMKKFGLQEMFFHFDTEGVKVMVDF